MDQTDYWNFCDTRDVQKQNETDFTWNDDATHWLRDSSRCRHRPRSSATHSLETNWRTFHAKLLLIYFSECCLIYWWSEWQECFSFFLPSLYLSCIEFARIVFIYFFKLLKSGGRGIFVSFSRILFGKTRAADQNLCYCYLSTIGILLCAWRRVSVI